MIQSTDENKQTTAVLTLASSTASSLLLSDHTPSSLIITDETSMQTPPASATGGAGHSRHES